MTLSWFVCVILFAAVIGSGAFFLEDDPLVEKVKAIVAQVDSYLTAEGLNGLSLPDIGTSLKAPVQLTNGGFGVFSSLYLQNATSVQQTPQEDGSILYTFDILLGLSELLVHYDFDVSVLSFTEKGNFTLSVQKNSAEVTGYAVVNGSSSCKADIYSVDIRTLGDYNITIAPDNIPGLSVISEAILNFISPYLLPYLNKSVKSALFVPGLQEVFSKIACPELV